MEELKFKESKELRRRLGGAVKSLVKTGARKASPYAQKILAFMMLLSSGNVSAEKLHKYSEHDNKEKVELSSFEVGAQEGMSVDTKFAETGPVVFETLEECRQAYGDDLKLDISQMIFSMSDLELAKGKESETARKMLDTALKNRTPKGYCTRNSKKTIRAMGWANGLSKEDRNSFDNIVPAWGLLPFLQAGKIGPLTEIRINPKELESKTTPIPLMRVNEAGETVNSHTQFMCPKGAVFGSGIEVSPEYHKENGKRQKYGTAHFFGDKETIENVVMEVTKAREDVMLVFDASSKTASVISLDNVPQDCRLAVVRYRRKKQTPVLDMVKPVDLAISATEFLKVPENITITQHTPSTKGNAGKKIAQINAAYAKKSGMSKG